MKKLILMVVALMSFVAVSAQSEIVANFNKDSKMKLSVEGPWAAMTNAEYQKMLTAKRSEKNNAVPMEESEINLKAATELDLRDQGVVPPIRDQGSCGSCYSFAALAAVESRLLIAGSSFTKSNIDFSEQQLVDCSTDQGNKGCNGGSLVATFRHIKVNGIMKESDYPYTEAEGTCALVSSKVVAKIGGQKTVTSNDESALQTAVAEGPVAVAIDASTIKFQLYSSGVFDDSNCSSTTLNHGVAAVGYGTESGTDYWIVRNSWGSSWGEDGYIRMSRNKDNQCSILTGVWYPTDIVEK